MTILHLLNEPREYRLFLVTKNFRQENQMFDKLSHILILAV